MAQPTSTRQSTHTANADSAFERFVSLAGNSSSSGQFEQLEAFGVALTEEGFTIVRRFLDAFRGYLRTYEDNEAQAAAHLVSCGRLALPQLKRTSPSWADIWPEYGCIVQYKNKVLAAIPAHKREGEWQVLLDNPFTNQNIVVYPALSFGEAAYLYGYFRFGLTANEYIRMQKVDTLIADEGVAQL